MIRRTPAAAPVVSRTPKEPTRRKEAVRVVTKYWTVSKYRSQFQFSPGHKVTVFQPDTPLREFLVEFRTGLRLKVSGDALEEFTKEA